MLGAAVTSAVLTGALLVGDSVRGSLKALTMERLGQIESAFVAQRFFDVKVTERLTGDPELREAFKGITPLILLKGAAVHAESGLRASKVKVHGINKTFPQLYDLPDSIAGQFPAGFEGAQGFPPVAINQALADELRAQVGDSLLIHTSTRGAVNPDFLLGSRDTRDLVGTLRGELVYIFPDAGMGGFSVEVHQQTPKNVFVPLDVLQGEVGQVYKINTLLLSGGAGGEASRLALENGLLKNLSLDDYGLGVRMSGQDAVLESRDMLFPPGIEQAVRTAARRLGIDVVPVFTYLANRIESGNRTVPYSTVSAIDLGTYEEGKSYQVLSGSAGRLQEDEILLNEWTANDLGVGVGDSIAVEYYEVGWQEELNTRSSAFRVKGILSMEGLALDQSLTPVIPGVDEARNMASWNPPVPIDLSQIRPNDEKYWEQYRTSPKAFIGYQTGLSLWKNRFGGLTSIRFNTDQTSVEEFRRELSGILSPDQVGVFLPLKEMGLQAAEGTTDFGMLFIGFSLFLIVSATLLAALLFRLGVEIRAREIGILLGLGFTVKSIRKRFLAEGAILVLLGTLVGILIGMGYASVLILGLRTVWVKAIGTPFLQLYVGWVSLLLGALIAFLAVLLSIVLTIRALTKLSVTSMLSGNTTRAESLSGKFPKYLAGACALVSALLLGIVFIQGFEESPAVFFGLGACLLVLGLVLFSIWLAKGKQFRVSPDRQLTLLLISLRNAARNRSRSLLCIVLVGSASFLIVAVGANQSRPGGEIWEMNSGAGGFGLLAETDIPLVRDLNDPEALFDLGFSDQEIEQLQGSDVVSFRLLPGDDVSCNNLFQPGRPRILGVPNKLISRGGFRFQALESDLEEPWSLLNDDLGSGVVPAFGDANSVLWILHKGLGEDVVITDESGAEVRLRLVGLLSRSIFQRELLVSEENLMRHFPGQSGHSFHLIETPPETIQVVSEVLENRLGEFGFDASSTAQVLEGFFAVENTYLATFQVLGGLGLLLGTVGLGIILVRNTNERRGELAVLRAFGFSEQRISRIIFNEHLLLLVLGIALGTSAALLAVAPHLLRSGADVPWVSLGLTLLGILAIGGLATSISVKLAFRGQLLTELRQE